MLGHGRRQGGGRGGLGGPQVCWDTGGGRMEAGGGLVGPQVCGTREEGGWRQGKGGEG